MSAGWRLIRDGARDAAWNMAADEAILDAVIAGEQPPTVRFYRWARPSISLGRFQKPEKVLHLALCRQRGVPVVQRLTGGKAVLHGHDLTLCVVAPLRCFLPAHRVIEVHLRIVQALACGFRRLGVPVSPVGRVDAQALRGAHVNCFDHALPGDLTDSSGVKLLGGAQYRRGDVVMEQVSIPFESLPEVLKGCLRPWREPLETPLMGIEEHHLVTALLEGLAEGLGVHGEWSALDESEVVRARCLQPGYVR